MKPIAITPERVTILGLILFIIILFFWKPCNKDAEQVAQLKAENKEVKKELKQKEDTINAILAKHSRDSAEWKGKEQLAFIERQEADVKFKQQQKTIDRLVTVIRVNTGRPIDSSFVLVSPEFKEACEDMPRAIEELNKVIAEKDTAISEWTNILAYEVQQRDSTIEALGVQIGRVMELNERQNKIAEDALKAAKRRGMFLVGAGNLFLPGDTFNPHIAAAYQNKDGKQFQGKVGIVNGKQYYEGTALIPLFR